MRQEQVTATRGRAEAENPAILETSEPVSSTASHDVTVNDSLQQSFIVKYLVEKRIGLPLRKG
jgi:hypothetical protein